MRPHFGVLVRIAAAHLAVRTRQTAEALGRKKSDIVRQAIDELYARFEASQGDPQ